jgi:hypothetical protein
MEPMVAVAAISTADRVTVMWPFACHAQTTDAMNNTTVPAAAKRVMHAMSLLH